MELKFRNLNADEIEVRVQSVNDKGAILLLYKNARVDMDILDEVVTPMNWKKEYLRDNRNCVVSIYDEDKKEWISKEDTGTESNTEKEKGLASDSFKRACFNWGIGRELYTSPFIWVNAKNLDIQVINGKYTVRNKFKVTEIGYDSKNRINKLEIMSDKGEIVFNYGVKAQPKRQATPSKTPEENLGLVRFKELSDIVKDPETIKGILKANGIKNSEYLGMLPELEYTRIKKDIELTMLAEEKKAWKKGDI